MAILSKIWKSKISFPTKIKLFRSLVMSILLYGYESWAITPETTRRVQSFETKCFRRVLGISWRNKRTNDLLWSQITSLAGSQEPLLIHIRGGNCHGLETSRATTQCPKQSSRAN
jgi:hypothetical protein